MRIRGGYLGFSHIFGWREEKREKRVVGKTSFFFIGSSWCVNGFYEKFEIKYEGVAFHGVVFSRVISLA